MLVHRPLQNRFKGSLPFKSLTFNPARRSFHRDGRTLTRRNMRMTSHLPRFQGRHPAHPAAAQRPPAATLPLLTLRQPVLQSPRPNQRACPETPNPKERWVREPLPICLPCSASSEQFTLLVPVCCCDISTSLHGTIA